MAAYQSIHFFSKVDTDKATYELSVFVNQGITSKLMLVEETTFDLAEFFDVGGYLHRQPVRTKIIDELWKKLITFNKNGTQ